MRKKIREKQKRKVIVISIVVGILAVITLTGISTTIRVRAEEKERTRVEEELRIKEEKTKQLKSEIEKVYEQEHTDIELAINSTVNESKRYGIYYEDLTTGKKVTYNKDKHFTAASTIKVALVMDAADMINKGTLKEDEKLTYTANEYEGGTGILQGNVVAGKSKIEVSKLIELAITHSDNIATQMLKKRCENISTYIYIKLQEYLGWKVEII